MNRTLNSRTDAGTENLHTVPSETRSIRVSTKPIAAATPTPINTAEKVQFKVKGTFTTTTYTANQIGQEGGYVETGVITLNEFPLKNIDEMRTAILKRTDLGEEFEIGELGKLPYTQINGLTPIGNNYSYFNLNGLCVKTYQSDIFSITG